MLTDYSGIDWNERKQYILPDGEVNYNFYELLARVRKIAKSAIRRVCGNRHRDLYEDLMQELNIVVMDYYATKESGKTPLAYFKKAFYSRVIKTLDKDERQDGDAISYDNPLPEDGEKSYLDRLEDTAEGMELDIEIPRIDWFAFTDKENELINTIFDHGIWSKRNPQYLPMLEKLRTQLETQGYYIPAELFKVKNPPSPEAAERKRLRDKERSETRKEQSRLAYHRRKANGAYI